MLRSRTTRQRRFIRPASFAGLSFLLERRGRHGENIAPNPRAPDRVGQDGPMADYTHTIDRWDDATVRRRRLPGGGEALAKGQDHAAQPGAGAREELAGLTVVARLIARPLQAEFI